MNNTQLSFLEEEVRYHIATETDYDRQNRQNIYFQNSIINTI